MDDGQISHQGEFIEARVEKASDDLVSRYSASDSVALGCVGRDIDGGGITVRVNVKWLSGWKEGPAEGGRLTIHREQM